LIHMRVFALRRFCKLLNPNICRRPPCQNGFPGRAVRYLFNVQTGGLQSEIDESPRLHLEQVKDKLNSYEIIQQSNDTKRFVEYENSFFFNALQLLPEYKASQKLDSNVSRDFSEYGESLFDNVPA